MRRAIVFGGLIGLLSLASHQGVVAQGTVFTYQGSLSQNSVPFTGVAEIAPTLRDAASGGNAVATNNPATILVSVSGGLFTTSLNFGSTPFEKGSPRWLQLQVRTALGPFTTLTPLQQLTATPYAMVASYAAMGGTATNFTGSLGGDVTGTQTSTVVGSLGGQPALVVASGAMAANAATSGSAPNTLVKRDGSGSFSAGAISATSLSAGAVVAASLAGNGSNLTAINATNLTGTMPLARLSGITSNQLAPSTWQFLVALASGTANGSTNGPPLGAEGMMLISGGGFVMGNSIGDADMTAWVPVTANISGFYLDANLVT